MPNRELKLLTAIFMLAIFTCGCTLIETIPNPKDVLKEPLGKPSLRPGMSKQLVESKWGKPDEIRMVEDPKRWASSREMWVYHGQTGLPIDADYLSRTRKIYFDGNNLTDIDQ